MRASKLQMMKTERKNSTYLHIEVLRGFMRLEVSSDARKGSNLWRWPWEQQNEIPVNKGCEILCSGVEGFGAGFWDSPWTVRQTGSWIWGWKVWWSWSWNWSRVSRWNGGALGGAGGSCLTSRVWWIGTAHISWRYGLVWSPSLFTWCFKSWSRERFWLLQVREGNRESESGKCLSLALET